MANKEHTDKYLCQRCTHYRLFGTCVAFPDGIPEEVIKGDNNHSKPLPEQDNDIVFEPIDKND